jgi:hypothetical protein
VKTISQEELFGEMSTENNNVGNNREIPWQDNNCTAEKSELERMSS